MAGPDRESRIPEDGDDEARPDTLSGFLADFTRYVLPAIIAIFGIVLIAVGHASYSNLATTRSVESATGVAFLIVALIVWMINWMYRLGVSSNEDREQEERAREYFDRTGRWPEDEPR